MELGRLVLPSPSSVSFLFFLQLATVLLACWGVGRLLRRLGQTQVVADMVAGFLLGPTLLGFIAPQINRWLFPTTVDINGQTVTHPSLTVLYTVGQLGLACYMFVVGLNFDGKLLRKHLGQSAATAGAGVTVPVLAGGAVGWVMASSGDGLFASGVKPWQAAVFVGAALAITAFPMLARIIHESGLTSSRVGTIALAAAAVEDAFAWILLAVVVSAASGNLLTVATATAGTVAYLGLMLLLRRTLPAFTKRIGTLQPDGKLKPEVFALTIVLLSLCAWFTDIIGIYAVFGAFALGIVIPRGELTEQLSKLLEPVTVYVLLPMFFVYSGLNTRLDVLLDPSTLALAGGVLVLAIVSKGGACVLVSRIHQLSWRDSLRLGSLMNARGLMELILLNIGLNAGLITDRLYTVLALMTVVTTLAVAPLFNLANRAGTPKETPRPEIPDRTPVPTTETTAPVDRKPVQAPRFPARRR